jgi:hypothetical protein
MMQWEEPLMALHAEYICWAGEVEEEMAYVVNIGHGMGLVDKAIQSHKPAFHLVIEAHPQVYARAQLWATENKLQSRGDIRVVHGKWQHTLLAEVEKLGRKLDGVFFDTWEETVEELLPLLPRILRPNGRFSFCNMYQPHDSLRHAAYSLYLATRLAAIGLACEFRPVDNPGAAPAPREDGEGIWSDVRYQYWTHDTYLLPLCTLAASGPPPPPRPGSPPARPWASGDGRPAHMLLWNAKFWYCQSLCDQGSGAANSRGKAAAWRGDGGGGGGRAAGGGGRPAGGSLQALWGRHCDAERAQLQAARAIEPDERGREAGEGRRADARLEPAAAPRKRGRGDDPAPGPAAPAEPAERGSEAEPPQRTPPGGAV